MKKTFDGRVKEEQFQVDDLVLKWDARKVDKHGKFDHLWKLSFAYVINTKMLPFSMNDSCQNLLFIYFLLDYYYRSLNCLVDFIFCLVVHVLCRHN